MSAKDSMELVLPVSEDPNLAKKPKKAIKAQVKVILPVPYTDIPSDRLVNCRNINVTGGNYCQYYKNSDNETLIETCEGVAPSGLAGKGFYLKPEFDWNLVKNGDYLLLIPTKKIGID